MDRRPLAMALALGCSSASPSLGGPAWCSSTGLSMSEFRMTRMSARTEDSEPNYVLPYCEKPPQERVILAVQRAQGLLCGRAVAGGLQAFCDAVGHRLPGATAAMAQRACVIELPVVGLVSFRDVHGRGNLTIFCNPGPSSAKVHIEIVDQSEPIGRGESEGSPVVSDRVYTYDIQIMGSEPCRRHGGDDLAVGLAILLGVRDPTVRARAEMLVVEIQRRAWSVVYGQTSLPRPLGCLDEPVDVFGR